MSVAASRLAQLKDSLLAKCRTKQVVAGVLGLGYVGLPLTVALHDGGISVVGVDSDAEKVRKLSAGQSYIGHIGDGKMQDLAASPRFTATSDCEDVARCDVLVVCLPTPLGPHQEPDMSMVFDGLNSVVPFLSRGSLVIMESTLFPGATELDIRDALCRLSAHGRDLFLANSPEREDPCREIGSIGEIPKLVGGETPEAGDIACEFYRSCGFASVVQVASAKVAESAKLLENTYRAVNIALVNELKVVFDQMDIDIWSVIDAAATKPFGFERFNPGPGIGGHCIPVDPFYLTWKSKEFGSVSRFVELAGVVNSSMPDYVVSKVQLALNQQVKPVTNSRILLLGIAYKPDVDDMRESPALPIWRALSSLGGIVSFHDPHIPVVSKSRKYASLAGTKSTSFSEIALNSVDCVVLVTPHKRILQMMHVLETFKGAVVDTSRNVPEGLYHLVRA